MIVFLYGPDDYRREQKRREIVAEFRKKHSDLGVGFFDMAPSTSLGAGGGAGIEDLAAFLRNQSIFEPKKLAVLQNVFPARKSSGVDEEEVVEAEDDSKEEGDGKALPALLKSQLDAANTTILISESKKPTKQFVFLGKKPVITQEFEALTGPAWESFIKAEAKRCGLTLSPSAARFLGDVHQGNSWALATEIQKLASFKKEIDLKDLDKFDLDVAPNYWGLLNGVKGYDVRSRLTALETLLAMNDPAAKLFNILASQWKEKIPQFAKYDSAIKSGKLEYEEALVDLVI
jgi:DNA polymerase III delta subunit